MNRERTLYLIIMICLCSAVLLTIGLYKDYQATVHDSNLVQVSNEIYRYVDTECGNVCYIVREDISCVKGE